MGAFSDYVSADAPAAPAAPDETLGDFSGGLRRGLRSGGAAFNRVAGTAAEAAGFNDFAAGRIAAAQAADHSVRADPAQDLADRELSRCGGCLAHDATGDARRHDRVENCVGATEQGLLAQAHPSALLRGRRVRFLARGHVGDAYGQSPILSAVPVGKSWAQVELAAARYRRDLIAEAAADCRAQERAELRARTSLLVGAEFTVLDDLNNGAAKPVQIQFTGTDSRKLLEITNDFMARLRKVPGAVDVGLGYLDRGNLLAGEQLNQLVCALAS